MEGRAKHTPGPWTVGALSGREDGHGMDEREVNGEADDVIATVWPIADDFNTDDAPEREANARLIAAAPELLEALRRFLRAENMIDDEYYAAIDAAEGEARALLARIEGRG